MMRYLLLAAALAACSGKSSRADSVDAAVPAIDTLKPVTASDTSAGRDSAFPPPRNLPRLDTVRTKKKVF
jgi:hypothetical protein